MGDFVYDLMTAMAKQEGFLIPGSRPDRNRNPLDIWDGLCAGKAKRIWPRIPVDDGGFLIFSEVTAGWGLGRGQLLHKIGRGLTLRQLIYEWTETDRDSYLAAVQHALGIAPDVPLSQYQMAEQGKVVSA